MKVSKFIRTFGNATTVRAIALREGLSISNPMYRLAEPGETARLMDDIVIRSRDSGLPIDPQMLSGRFALSQPLDISALGEYTLYLPISLDAVVQPGTSLAGSQTPSVGVKRPLSPLPAPASAPPPAKRSNIASKILATAPDPLANSAHPPPAAALPPAFAALSRRPPLPSRQESAAALTAVKALVKSPPRLSFVRSGPKGDWQQCGTAWYIDTAAEFACTNVLPLAGAPPSDTKLTTPFSTFSYASDSGRLVRTGSSTVMLDFDSTVVIPKDGKKFPDTADDWLYAFKSVPDTLRALAHAGVRIVIVSNQALASRDANVLALVRGRIRGAMDPLGVPYEAVFATTKDVNRKPLTGMWTIITARASPCIHSADDVCAPSPAGGDAVGEPSSLHPHASILYVGDAAGRPAGWRAASRLPTALWPLSRAKVPKPADPADHSAADVLFAANCRVPFANPEAVFADMPICAFPTLKYNPLTASPVVLSSAPSHPIFLPPVAAALQRSKVPEVVLLVGPPACGKTTIARTMFVDPVVQVHPDGRVSASEPDMSDVRRYVWVNRDTLGTPAKCLAATVAALKSGQSVVVDNTLPSAEARAPYIAAAAKAGAAVRAIVLVPPDGVSDHLNILRAVDPTSKRDPIPAVAFHTFRKYYTAPTVSEGLSSVVEVPFVPIVPDQDAADRYTRFYHA